MNVTQVINEWDKVVNTSFQKESSTGPFCLLKRRPPISFDGYLIYFFYKFFDKYCRFRLTVMCTQNEDVKGETKSTRVCTSGYCHLMGVFRYILILPDCKKCQVLVESSNKIISTSICLKLSYLNPKYLCNVWCLYMFVYFAFLAYIGLVPIDTIYIPYISSMVTI